MEFSGLKKKEKLFNVFLRNNSELHTLGISRINENCSKRRKKLVNTSHLKPIKNYNGLRFLVHSHM